MTLAALAPKRRKNGLFWPTSRSAIKPCSAPLIETKRAMRKIKKLQRSSHPSFCRGTVDSPDENEKGKKMTG
jgi:hypothetical protein